MKLCDLLIEDISSIKKYNNPSFIHTLESVIGNSSFICTYVASAIKMLEGNKVKIYGFSQKLNPEASYFKELNPDDIEEGHHFAVFENRYIIDPWIYNNYKNASANELFNRSIFDLQNPQDAKEIKYIYGNPNCWVDITNDIDDFQVMFPKESKQLMKYKR